MNRPNKILMIAVVLLLLANIGMLIFFFKGKNGGGKRIADKGEVFRKMVKDLSMTDSQQTVFKKMKEEHFANVKPVFDSVRSLKKSLFNLVKADNVNDSIITRYSTLISEQQAVADKLTINHFRKVRTLFSGEQQKKFDEFMENMMQRRSKGPAGKNE